MRILQVAPFFSPRLGGSPKVVYQISRELSKRGHKITVLAGDFGIRESSFPDESFNTIILKSIISKWGFYLTPSMIGWCRHHIREFDIIHLHEVRTFQNIIIHWFAKQYKIPYVLSAHGTLPVIIERRFFKRLYDLLFGRRIWGTAQYLISVSPVEESQYQQFGIEKTRIRMIYNGLDLKEFANLPTRNELRKKLGINEKTKIILYLGRLHKIKGIDILIEAFSKLNVNESNVLLLIAGPDDGELNRLQSLVYKKGIGDQVRFLGPLYNRDKLAAYVAADVLASPGVYEIFGLVPFEALMCGTPVVVTDDCGSGKLISDANAGYTVKYSNVEDITKALRYILINPEEAKYKVDTGQRFIRDHLDWNKNISEMERLYQDCLR